VHTFNKLNLIGEVVMKKLIKPTMFVMAFAIPAMASATVSSNQLSKNQVQITYNTEDVTTESGRVEIQRQVRRAAEKVCGPQRMMGSRSIRQLRENRHCFDETVDKALLRLNLAD